MACLATSLRVTVPAAGLVFVILRVAKNLVIAFASFEMASRLLNRQPEGWGPAGRLGSDVHALVTQYRKLVHPPPALVSACTSSTLAPFSSRNPTIFSRGIPYISIRWPYLTLR